jgi:hypothetical protein
MFEKLLGRGISIRVFPCGTAHRELALDGRLASRSGYLRDEHDTLFAKYGWGASEWTVIAQLATVPVPPDPGSEQTVQDNPGSNAERARPDQADGADEPEADEDEASDEVPDRAEFENLGIDLMKTLAEAGVIGAPRFPGITMTPIAIYRAVPTFDPALPAAG